MSKHHVGPNGPGECNAGDGNCPFGGESGSDNHYATEKEAQVAYDKSMEARRLPTMTKKKAENATPRSDEQPPISSNVGKVYSSSDGKRGEEQSTESMGEAEVDDSMSPEENDAYGEYMASQDENYWAHGGNGGTSAPPAPAPSPPKPRYDSGYHIDSSEGRSLARTIRIAEEALPKVEQRLREHIEAGRPNDGSSAVALNNQISEIKRHLKYSRSRLEEGDCGNFISDSPDRKTIRVNNRAQKAMLEGPMRDSFKGLDNVDVIIDRENPGCNFEVGEGISINRGNNGDDDIRRTVSSSYAGRSYPDVHMERDIADMEHILSTERPNYTVPSNYL